MKVAKTPADADEAAEQILGLDIKGHTVHRVMVDPGADIAEEYYFSFLLDRSNRTYLAMASFEGGMEIEQLAVERPEALARVPVDALAASTSTRPGRSRPPALPGRARRQGRRRARQAVGGLHGEDATLVEVNPLVKITAGDGYESWRWTARSPWTRTPTSGSPSTRRSTTWAPTDPLEAKAKEKHLNYVKLDGQVGIIGNGAGLVMSTLDVVAYAGEAPRGREAGQLPRHRRRRHRAEVMANGLDIILGDPQVKSVFVNVFGGITACDAVANGIVEALEILGDEANKPLVVRLDGNNVDEGRPHPDRGRTTRW